MMNSKTPTNNYVSFYNPNLSHHRAWLQAVLDRLVELDPSALQDGSELRDLWKAAVETSPGIAPQAAWQQPAMQIVKEYEGLELEAYPDPGTGGDPWTIGYGHTGPDVGPETVITKEKAENYLEADLQKASQGVFSLLPMAKNWTPNQQAAIISFAYNIGVFALENSTLRKRMLLGENVNTVVAQELPRWNRGENGVLPGLARRRAAEVKLFGASQSMSVQPVKTKNPLDVPWYSQLDSSTDQARRMCFSSSCAMLLEFLKPGTLKGPNGDDQYLETVQKFGDTTSSVAQVKALQSYGIKSAFIQNGSIKTIENQINKGIPVPAGYLHRGPVNSPSGGGHYLTIVGHDSTHFIVHDPLGESDLLTGETINRPARFCRYSKQNFCKRWEVKQRADGSYYYAPGNGWAIIASI